MKNHHTKKLSRICFDFRQSLNVNQVKSMGCVMNANRPGKFDVWLSTDCVCFTVESTWRPLVHSFNLDGTLKHGNRLVTALAATFDIIHSWFLDGILRHFIGFTVMSTNKNELSSNVVKWWRERGVTPVTWTVDTFSDKKFFGDQRVPVMTDSMIEDVVEQTFWELEVNGLPLMKNAHLFLIKKISKLNTQTLKFLNSQILKWKQKQWEAPPPPLGVHPVWLTRNIIKVIIFKVTSSL